MLWMLWIRVLWMIQKLRKFQVGMKQDADGRDFSDLVSTLLHLAHRLIGQEQGEQAHADLSGAFRGRRIAHLTSDHR